MIEKLKELTKIQCADGNWNHDEYMRGMANGMILSLAVLENKDPEYLEKPKQKKDNVFDMRDSARNPDKVLEKAIGTLNNVLLHHCCCFFDIALSISRPYMVQY